MYGTVTVGIQNSIWAYAGAYGLIFVPVYTVNVPDLYRRTCTVQVSGLYKSKYITEALPILVYCSYGTRNM